MSWPAHALRAGTRLVSCVLYTTHYYSLSRGRQDRAKSPREPHPDPPARSRAAIVLKSQALSIKVKPYIEAARVAGGSQARIIFVHIVPNLLPLSLLYMMFTVTSAIFAEAVLSFLGLLDLRMSWGIMTHTANAGGRGHPPGAVASHTDAAPSKPARVNATQPPASVGPHRPLLVAGLKRVLSVPSSCSPISD